MQRFIFVRLVHTTIALAVITVVVFAMIRATGSPVDALLPDDATLEEVERAEEYWGVNEPLHEQYFRYVKNIATGNFGVSFKWAGLTVRELIIQRIPASIELAGAAVLITVSIAVPIGVLAAVKRDTPFDQGSKLFAMLGQSLPNFWLGIVLIWIFAVTLGVLPTSGRADGLFGGSIDHIFLPAFSLGFYQVAALMRLTRSAMLDTLDSEYVKLARIKGLAEWKVIWKHCLRNAAIAPLTYFAFMGAAMLAGSVVIETVFAWPGLGLLALESVNAKDYEVVQTVILLFAFIYLFANLFCDILYAYLDPRIRYN